MTNITEIFNPPPVREHTSEESLDCLPCQIMSSLGSLGAGYYLGSGLVYKGDADFHKNPQWWRYSVKSAGVLLLAFGMYRGGQGWLWDKDIVYKPVKFL